MSVICECSNDHLVPDSYFSYFFSASSWYFLLMKWPSFTTEIINTASYFTLLLFGLFFCHLGAAGTIANTQLTYNRLLTWYGALVSNQLFIYPSSRCRQQHCLSCGVIFLVPYSLCFSSVFGHSQLLRVISGSLAAKCSIMLSNCVRQLHVNTKL